MLVGAYVAWVGIWELRPRHGSAAADPVVDRAAEVQTAPANPVGRVGPAGPALVLLLPPAPATVGRLRARRG